MSDTEIIPIPGLGRHAVGAYLLLGRRPVIVDAGMPGSGHAIYDQVARHGFDPKDIALIVLTHGHIDHFGSATELHRLTGTPSRATPPRSPPTAPAEPANRVHDLPQVEFVSEPVGSAPTPRPTDRSAAGHARPWLYVSSPQ